MNTSFELSIYSDRRALLAKQLGQDGVAVIPTAPEQQRNRDNNFSYRHDSYFYYLTGFTEPNAYLLVFSDGRSVLFCQPKDMEREIWDGYRLGPEEAVRVLGLSSAHSVNALNAELPKLLENKSCLWYPFSTHKGLATQIEQWLIVVQSKARAGIKAPSQLRDVCLLLDEMRLIKDRHELELMRAAGRISAAGHIKAMQFCANNIKNNQQIYEYQLEAELLYEFRRRGSDLTAYSSIVASGANACVLHYRADKAPIKNGELVLIDAGCEYASYAGDITRTFPSNGVFTKAQRAVYDVVLESQFAAISCTQVGALFTDPHQAALKVLAKGLLDLGILDSNKCGSAEDVLANKDYFPFYMHRTSHWLGMDVHDCGAYTEPGYEQQNPAGARVLRAGMVLTIEPGLYIRPNPQVPEMFHGIGIRIEDDALVTDKGCELLSRDVPVEVLEIEKLMC